MPSPNPVQTMLEQYTAAKLEMQRIDFEASQLHAVTDHVKGSMEDYPYTERTVRITGIDPSIGDLVQQRRSALADKRRAVELFIAQIDDSYIATIIRLRYIEGREWEAVADVMNADGAHYTSAGLKKALSRFIKSCHTCHA